MIWSLDRCFETVHELAVGALPLRCKRRLENGPLGGDQRAVESVALVT